MLIWANCRVNEPMVAGRSSAGKNICNQTLAVHNRLPAETPPAVATGHGWDAAMNGLLSRFRKC